MTILRVCAFAFAALLIPSHVLACDFCMLGQGVNPYLTASGKGFTFEGKYIQSDHIYDQNMTVNSNRKAEGWDVNTLTGFYPAAENLTLMVAIPFVVKTNIDYDAATNSNPGTLVSDFGDATLTARYTFWTHHTLDTTLLAGLLAGVKFPTGSTDVRDIQGNPVDRHALPGTGSYDWNLGVTSSYSVAEGYQITLDAVYSFAGVGSWAGRTHQYGNSLNAALRGFYRIWPDKPQERSVFLFTGPLAEWTGKERGTQTDAGYDPDLINESSGGTVIYWEVGAYSVLSQSAIVNASISKGVYHAMNFNNAFDADPAENYKLDLALTFLF